MENEDPVIRDKIRQIEEGLAEDSPLRPSLEKIAAAFEKKIYQRGLEAYRKEFENGK